MDRLLRDWVRYGGYHPSSEVLATAAVTAASPALRGDAIAAVAEAIAWTAKHRCGSYSAERQVLELLAQAITRGLGKDGL